MLPCQSNSLDSWHPLFLVRGHSITTWTRWGEGVKKVCFCPHSRYKNCPRRGGGQKMTKFCPRSCWMATYHTIGCLSGMFWASLTNWYSSRFVIFVVAFSTQHQFNSHCWVSTSLFFSSSSFVFNALVFDACVAQMLLDYCWKNSIILKVELQFFPLFSFSSNVFFFSG